ncbi:hypothetical protein [Hymenobacter sp. BRD67]|uniref:hypothetical protein n=1 Tax=Hymenobacter sp. BRD67 TaxID=2675877 RepID=UPI0015632101|nr:hypothetical protein [Hymenobacter sp. BRD67]QKG53297.1 hypothetical protein GKZ67_12745 [Hymenobacter sp. BRD67]
MSLTAKILLSCAIVFSLSLGLYLYPILTNPFYSNLFSSSSEQELRENYQSHKKELDELKAYFNSITPSNLVVDIEFNDLDNASMKISYPPDKISQGKSYFAEWEFNPYHYKELPAHSTPHADYDPEVTSLSVVKERLHWTDDTFRAIAAHLAKANCIGVQNGEPTKISFRMSGMGRYSYNIFSQPISDSLRPHYNNTCTYRLFTSTVAFEYGGVP